MKTKSNIKAYNLQHPFILAILIVILLISYLLCCYLDAQDDKEQLQNVVSAVKNDEYTPPAPTNDHPFRDTFKNFLVISISILLSSVVTIAFVGKSDRNSIYSEAFDDLIDKSDIKIELHDLNTEQISFLMEKKLKTSDLPSGLFETITKKIAEPDLPYYYENCKVDVSCHFDGKYFIKTVKKDLYIKSYAAEHTFSRNDSKGRFRIAQQMGMKGISSPLKVESFSVYDDQNKAIDKTAEFAVERKTVSSPVYKKLGYTNKVSAYYKQDLTIHNTKCTHISVLYETKSAKDDLSYVFRMPCSCKQLDFKFALNDENYRITGHAFGFFDDAKETATSGNKNELNFVFENWIFKRDGICINIIKKEK